MTKKTPLSLIRSQQQSTLSPPPTLGEAGKVLWLSIMREYAIQDSGGLATLEQVAVAWDRAAECAAQIGRDGLLVMSKHGARDHPLLKHELAARAFVVRTLTRLGISVEPVRPIGRPGSGGIGVTWDKLDR